MGCQRLSQMFLSSSTQIRELNLEENNILDIAGAILVQNLLRYNNLNKLNLNKNFLGGRFAEQIKRILKGGDKQLLELYLAWNQFGSKAVKSILEGLAQHTCLKVFDFSWNKIGEQNASLLAKGI